jgi:hypothetical protein
LGGIEHGEETLDQDWNDLDPPGVFLWRVKERMRLTSAAPAPFPTAFQSFNDTRKVAVLQTAAPRTSVAPESDSKPESDLFPIPKRIKVARMGIGTEKVCGHTYSTLEETTILVDRLLPYALSTSARPMVEFTCPDGSNAIQGREWSGSYGDCTPGESYSDCGSGWSLDYMDFR